MLCTKWNLTSYGSLDVKWDLAHNWIYTNWRLERWFLELAFRSEYILPSFIVKGYGIVQALLYSSLLSQIASASNSEHHILQYQFIRESTSERNQSLLELHSISFTFPQPWKWMHICKKLLVVISSIRHACMSRCPSSNFCPLDLDEECYCVENKGRGPRRAMELGCWSGSWGHDFRA